MNYDSKADILEKIQCFIENNINIFLLNVLIKIVDSQNVFSLNKSSKRKKSKSFYIF